MKSCLNTNFVPYRYVLSVAEYDDVALVVLKAGFKFVMLIVTVGEQQTIGLFLENEHI